MRKSQTELAHSPSWAKGPTESKGLCTLVMFLTADVICHFRPVHYGSSFGAQSVLCSVWGHYMECSFGERLL